MKPVLYAGLISLLGSPPFAATLTKAQKQSVAGEVETRADDLATISKTIWDYAEVGYREVRSSELLQQELAKAGFTVKSGIADIPTAFVASYKNGSGPVIAILAEYDALPGLAQTTAPAQTPIPGQAAGHGCGHNVFAAASVTAAIAVKAWMVQNGIKGELRLYGTPAEEGGSGKVYMVRAGLFDDVSAALHWHASDHTGVKAGKTQANISGRFRFSGLSAHASAAADRGRSALDGVEVMNVAANYLREHVPIGTRIHYIVSNGGKAPNVVPDFAESYYYIRQADPAVVRSVWGRLEKAAEGAALATGTTVKVEITGGVYSMLGNKTLAEVLDRNLQLVGGPEWSAEDKVWAQTIGRTLENKIPLEAASRLDPISYEDTGGSTDVSDVSWVVPTIGLNAATWVPGTPGHSWQATAASGHAIGAKGGVVAAKALAVTAADLFASPETLAAAKKELVAARGANFKYQPMLGNRAPALNYRDE